MMQLATILGFLSASVLGRQCPQELHAVFADMHDGDKKEITIDGTSVTIKPSGNNQTWVVKAVLDAATCQATIDFNVPGKPNPPPVNLLMTLWLARGNLVSAGREKATFEFTDPSGKLASPETPLNSWLSLGTPEEVEAVPCPDSLSAVYADMHDGDKKAVEISSGKLTIKPSGNNQTWVVSAELDSSCTADVDFNVPGKPSPPPVPLQLQFWRLQTSGTAQKTSFEFTDPSGTIAPPAMPLNAWLQLGLVA